MAAFDFSREYGVVLEGGGAKGAYQIGVWKAFREMGVRIQAVAGVSVGALNGVLMATGEYELAEKIWENIQYSMIMDVKDEQMKKVMNGRLREMDYKLLTADSARMLAEGGIDITPLQNLIEQCVEEEKLRKSPVKFYLSTFSIDKFKELQLSVDDMEPGYVKDYLMASAYLPVFKNVPLHGKHYMDGGVVNKTPLDILIKEGYPDIIVIRIFGFGVDKKVKIPSGVRVLEVAPRVNLGKVLDFDNKKSVRNMTIGYYDGMRLLQDLKGKIYYIRSGEPEQYFIRRIAQVPEAVKMLLIEWAGGDLANGNSYDRQMFELVLPAVASELKLGKDWNYQELYLAVLELCAKNLRVKKYNIYTIDELAERIVRKYRARRRQTGEGHSAFIEIMMKAVVTSKEEIDKTGEA